MTVVWDCCVGPGAVTVDKTEARGTVHTNFAPLVEAAEKATSNCHLNTKTVGRDFFGKKQLEKSSFFATR